MLNLLGSLISPIGNMLAAILFFVVAIVVAEIVKNFTVKFLKKVKVDEKLKKFGVEEEKSTKYIESVGKRMIVSLTHLSAMLNNSPNKVQSILGFLSSMS